MVETGRKKANLPFFTSDENPKFVPMWMAENIMKDYNFATHEQSEEIYYYDNGVYKPGGEVIIKREAQKRLGKYSKNRFINETVGAIERANYTPSKKFNNPGNGIVVENGMLDIENRELKEHSPDYVHTTKIPWKYDPEVECPKIKEFISSVVNDDDVKVIQEMFGYCLYKGYPISKAFMFLGSGANGKSTLLQLLEEFVGSDNVATPSLQKLLNDDHARIDLFGSLVNIHADLSSKKLENTGTFKMLTGGDTIRARQLYQKAFKFRNHAKLIYSANELPKTTDRTEAFFRRWIVIDFPYHFGDDEEDTDPNLPYSIISEEEMSGLLNWALDGLDRVLENGGFSHTQSRDEIKDKWIMQTDSLRAFLDICVEQKDGYHVPKKEFYEAYKEFCSEHNIYNVKKGQVTRRLPSIKPRASLYRPKINGSRKRCWNNIKFTEQFEKNYDYKSRKKGEETEEQTSSKTNLKSYDNKKDKALSVYPEDKVKSYVELESEAQQKGIDPEDFNEWHEKLLNDGEIHETEPGKYKRL